MFVDSLNDATDFTSLSCRCTGFVDVSPEDGECASDVFKISSESPVSETCEETTCSNSQVSGCACTVDASLEGGGYALEGLRASL